MQLQAKTQTGEEERERKREKERGRERYEEAEVPSLCAYCSLIRFMQLRLIIMFIATEEI